MQDLFFFKKSTESLEARRENFNASIFKARSVFLSPGESPEDPCETNIVYNTYSTTAHSKKSIVNNISFIRVLYG